MAAETVDAVVADLGGSAPSRTAAIPLGLQGKLQAAAARAESVARVYGVEPAVAAGLVERHGDDAVALLEQAVERDETDPLVPDLPYVRAELRWAIEHELALSVDDVLRRRLRVALRDRAAGGDVARQVGALLAELLGWDDATAKASVQEYRREVSRERGVVPVTAR